MSGLRPRAKSPISAMFSRMHSHLKSTHSWIIGSSISNRLIGIAHLCQLGGSTQAKLFMANRSHAIARPAAVFMLYLRLRNSRNLALHTGHWHAVGSTAHEELSKPNISSPSVMPLRTTFLRYSTCPRWL